MTQVQVEPIRKSISVEAPLERAFAVFTDGISGWWPLETHSVGAGRDGVRAESATLEPADGGRLYERMSDGREAAWGRVLVWEPPHRVVLTWHPGTPESEATELELRFTAEGEGTRVELEHRGWERLAEKGKDYRARYDGGWDEVLARYAEAASG